MSQHDSADLPQFYTTPGQVWQAMLEDCRRATRSIQCEQYILEDNTAGHAFLEIFIQKAREGVAVCLVLDGVGSRCLIGEPLVADLRQAGGRVHFYNRMRWYNIVTPWLWLPRNHNKLLLIDDHTGYVGSACIDDDMRNWRDIVLRFSGPLIATIAQEFASLCHSLTLTDATEQAYDIMTPTLNGLLHYSVSRQRLKINPIYRELLQAIRQAKHSVLLVTPYFLPPRRLMSALRRAARQGVNVTIVAGEATDIPIADCISRSFIPWLVRNHIHLQLYQNNVLHAKYAIIDNDWAMLGSTNLDYLSLMHNREANLIIRDKTIIDQLQSQFQTDLSNTIQAGKNYWRQLPLYYRIAGYIGRLFKRLL